MKGKQKREIVMWRVMFAFFSALIAVQSFQRGDVFIGLVASATAVWLGVLLLEGKS